MNSLLTSPRRKKKLVSVTVLSIPGAETHVVRKAPPIAQGSVVPFASMTAGCAAVKSNGSHAPPQKGTLVGEALPVRVTHADHEYADLLICSWAHVRLLVPARIMRGAVSSP